MRLPQSRPRPELEALIEQAKHRPPMTPSELQAQRISFAFGMLPDGSTVSREDVAAADYAKYGDLAEMEARLASAEAMAEALTDGIQSLEMARDEIAELRSTLSKSDFDPPWLTDAEDKMRLALAKWRAGK